MGIKSKTFWLNIGLIDSNLELSYRKNILEVLAKQSVEVRASFNFYEKIFNENGLDKVWFVRLPRKGIIGNVLLAIKQQLVLIKNLDVDVIILRPFSLIESLPLWIIYRIILGHNRPLFVLDVRTYVADFPGLLKKIQRKIRFDISVYIAFKIFDGITVITEKMKNDLQSKVKNFSKKICIWSSGMDPDVFNPDSTHDLKDKLNLKDRFIIMYHGILSPGRGLQETVKSISIIRKLIPEIMLFLLGKGPAQSELEDIILERDLGRNVYIHPAVPFSDVPNFIKTTDAGILPFPDFECWNSSSPIKLTEYLAMEKPVIVTDIEAHRDALGQNRCGFFIPNHHPESIAAGIKEVYDKRADLPALGKISRKIALERFTLEKQAVKIKNYFENLLDSS